MLEQNLLHFGGEHVLAPGNEHVFPAIDNVVMAIGIAAGYVAAVKPAPIADRVRGGIGAVPVTRRYAGAPHQQLACLAAGHISSLSIHNANLNQQLWAPYRAGFLDDAL